MPLASAIEYLSNGDVKNILQSGKQQAYQYDHEDKETPLHKVARHGFIKKVNILLEYDDTETHINHQSKNGLTALILACIHGHYQVVQELIIKGANIYIKTENCDAALIYASWNGHKKIVELLLNHDDSLKHVNQRNNGGDTSLMAASYKGYKEIVKMLLKYGADVDILNNKGKSAADVAKTEEIKELLLNWEPKGVKKAKGV